MAEGAIEIPLRTNVPDWVQDESGWWTLQGHKVVLVNPQTGFVTVAANCPWQVDVDMSWANRVMDPGIPAPEEPTQPAETPAPTHSKRGDAFVWAMAIVAVLILAVVLSPVLVSCGVVR